MTSRTTKFTVFFTPAGQPDAVPAGRLSLVEDATNVLGSEFVYGLRYLERTNAADLDPVSLRRPAPGTGSVRLVPSNSLTEFGALRDAAPDLWGRRVIENKLRKTGPLPESVYLEHAGPNRVGAIEVRDQPDSPAAVTPLAGMERLEMLLQAVELVERGEPIPERLMLLTDAGASLGGARPKAIVEYKGEQWLAKFPAREDRFNTPAIEYATLTLAAEVLHASPVKLIRLADRRDIVLVKRFDRKAASGSYLKQHYVSALTLLGKHESESSQASYADIAAAIGEYGATGSVMQDRVELFRRMVFNILVGNDDDHLRNHGFLLESSGWKLSPLFDVVPKPQVSQDRNQHLGVGARGRHATLDNALSHAGQFGLTMRQAAQHIMELVQATRCWKNTFEEAGVLGRDIDAVSPAFRHWRDIGGDAVEKLARQTMGNTD